MRNLTERDRENNANGVDDDTAATTHDVAHVAPNVVVAAIVAARGAPALKPQEKTQQSSFPMSL